MTATLPTPTSTEEERNRRSRTSHEVSEQALREICSIELIEAQLHHRKLTTAILQLRDHAGGSTGGQCPAVPQVEVAVIDGLGPVDPQLARQLAGDARWIRMITDPVTGVIRDVGTTTYTVPAAMDRRIKARDHHCRFPGCTKPAKRCDIDDVTPYPNGPTAETNALTLCTRHHRVKHQTRWQITLKPDSTAVWTSPTGQQHRTKPPPGD